MTKSRTLRKAGAVVLSLAMAFSGLAITSSDADAAAKAPALSAKKATLAGGKSKTVTIKNAIAKKVSKLTVKTSNKKVATVTFLKCLTPECLEAARRARF